MVNYSPDCRLASPQEELSFALSVEVHCRFDFRSLRIVVAGHLPCRSRRILVSARSARCSQATENVHQNCCHSLWILASFHSVWCSRATENVHQMWCRLWILVSVHSVCCSQATENVHQ